MKIYDLVAFYGYLLKGDQVLPLLISMAAVFLADRALKVVIRKRTLGWSRSFGFHLEFIHSRHVIERFFSRWVYLTGLAVATAILSLVLRSSGAGAQMCLGAALGGAVSNCSDASCTAGVVNCFAFRRRRVFNLADVAIVCGTLVGLSLLVLCR